MIGQPKADAIKTIHLFRGLTDQELDEVAKICHGTHFSEGQICQDEGQATNRVHLIVNGKVGSVSRIPNITSSSSEIVLEVLHEGDVFGWSSLIKGTPSWPALRALAPLDALYVNTDDLLNLCERNNGIGYIIMRNLSSLIASRLRRNRMSMLNTIVAMKGEW
jgi:CRP-like cAMP-binding protein